MNKVEDIAILHYAGKEKTWDYHYLCEASKPYLQVLKKQKRYKELNEIYAKHLIMKT